MAKKARKKTARRKVAGRSAGGKSASRRGASLRGVTTTDLQAELKRRASELGPLKAKREELMAEVAEIDGEIAFLSAALGGAARAPSPRAGAVRRGRAVSGRKRPRNEKSLEVALSEVLKGKTMGVTEVANAVQKAGYRTTSPNFRTIVNQTLIRSELIKQIVRGAYTSK